MNYKKKNIYINLLLDLRAGKNEGLLPRSEYKTRMKNGPYKEKCIGS